MTEIENLKAEIANLKAVLIDVIKVLRCAETFANTHLYTDQVAYELDIDKEKLYFLLNNLLKQKETEPS